MLTDNRSVDTLCLSSQWTVKCTNECSFYNFAKLETTQLPYFLYITCHQTNNVALTQHVTPNSHLYDILYTEPITVIHRLTAKFFLLTVSHTPTPWANKSGFMFYAIWLLCTRYTNICDGSAISCNYLTESRSFFRLFHCCYIYIYIYIYIKQQWKILKMCVCVTAVKKSIYIYIYIYIYI